MTSGEFVKWSRPHPAKFAVRLPRMKALYMDDTLTFMPDTMLLGFVIFNFEFIFQ